MALPGTNIDRQYRSFVETDLNEVARRVVLSGGASVNPLAKYLEMTETSTTVETYEYYESSSKVTLYNTIVVTYTSDTKAVLASVEWS